MKLTFCIFRAKNFQENPPFERSLMRPNSIDEGMRNGIVTETLLDIYKHKDKIDEERVTLKWVEPFIFVCIVLIVTAIALSAKQEIVLSSIMLIVVCFQWVRSTPLLDVSETGKFLTRCVELSLLLSGPDFVIKDAEKSDLDDAVLQFLEEQAETLERRRLEQSSEEEIEYMEESFRNLRNLFANFDFSSFYSADTYLHRARKQLKPTSIQDIHRRRTKGKMRLI